MKLMKIVNSVVVLLLVSGCASQNSGTSVRTMLVAPAEVNYKVELTLAKLSEYLQSPQLTGAQRAQFLYDRGVLYDSVGLKTLARIDFHRALKLQPTLADAYNFLGIYYTQDQAYGRAFEAFDAVLELQPEYEYAYLNRGLASYYNDRNDLALRDLRKFYDLNQQDGYRVIWLYFAQAQTDKKLAKDNLILHRSQLNDNHWDAKLIDLMLGKLTQEQIFVASTQGLRYRNEMAERMCEVYFYTGKMAQIEGRHMLALDYFKLALSTNVYDFVEHRYSRLELYRSLVALQ